MKIINLTMHQATGNLTATELFGFLLVAVVVVYLIYPIFSRFYKSNHLNKKINFNKLARQHEKIRRNMKTNNLEAAND